MPTREATTGRRITFEVAQTSDTHYLDRVSQREPATGPLYPSTDDSRLPAHALPPSAREHQDHAYERPRTYPNQTQLSSFRPLSPASQQDAEYLYRPGSPLSTASESTLVETEDPGQSAAPTTYSYREREGGRIRRPGTPYYPPPSPPIICFREDQTAEVIYPGPNPHPSLSPALFHPHASPSTTLHSDSPAQGRGAPAGSGEVRAGRPSPLCRVHGSVEFNIPEWGLVYGCPICNDANDRERSWP